MEVKDPVQPVKATAKKAQITAVFTVNESGESELCNRHTKSDEPDKEQTNGKGETIETVSTPQVSGFEVKAIVFDITKHLLNPHTARVQMEGKCWTGEIGG